MPNIKKSKSPGSGSVLATAQKVILAIIFIAGYVIIAGTVNELLKNNMLECIGLCLPDKTNITLLNIYIVGIAVITISLGMSFFGVLMFCNKCKTSN